MGAAPKMEGNPLLNKDLLQAFVKSVCETIATMANTTIQVGKPSIEKFPSAKGDVVGIIGMVAPPLKGTLIITFPKDTILKIMEHMIGEKYTEIGPETSDAVGELSNMIYGTAKTSLNNLGYKFEMAIPTVVMGDVKLSMVGNTPALLIPFTADNINPFFIEMIVN